MLGRGFDSRLIHPVKGPMNCYSSGSFILPAFMLLLFRFLYWKRYTQKGGIAMAGKEVPYKIYLDESELPT
ncbi:MAG: hypothetical protein IK125_00265, partial [Lachnospiraceae bacterium]|nr:hypothetical protein [Lachnospiraceae bacterium]